MVPVGAISEDLLYRCGSPGAGLVQYDCKFLFVFGDLLDLAVVSLVLNLLGGDSVMGGQGPAVGCILWRRQEVQCSRLV